MLSSGIMYRRLQRVTIPDVVIIKFVLLKMVHVNAQNMSRIVM